MWTTKIYPHAYATVPHVKALQLVCFGLHGPVAETSFKPHTALAVSWFAFHWGLGAAQESLLAGRLGTNQGG